MRMENMQRKLIPIVFIAAFAVINFFSFHSEPAKADTAAEQTQNQINDLEKKKKEVEAELAVEQSRLYKNQAQISTTRAILNQINADIARKETELRNLEVRAKLNRTMLAEYLRRIYYAGQENDLLIQLSLFNGNLNDVLANFDNSVSIKSKIIDALLAIREAKIKTEQTKETLADQQQDKQLVLKTQQVQHVQISNDVQETKVTLAEIQQKISKLRNTLSSFLGKSYSIDDVVEAVKFASKKTGVRKEFIFAMLDKESDLGRFTGGCTYNKSKMGSINEGIFKRITNELGYDYKKLKVSCPLSYGIGGAMGVAQFMPTTWGDPDGSPVGWRPRISSATGHNPPDPWSLTDGIVGMALKLKAAGADKKSGERNAAAAYYCGSRLSRAVCQNYANTVISWSKGYDDYF